MLLFGWKYSLWLSKDKLVILICSSGSHSSVSQRGCKPPWLNLCKLVSVMYYSSSLLFSIWLVLDWFVIHSWSINQCAVIVLGVQDQMNTDLNYNNNSYSFGDRDTTVLLPKFMVQKKLIDLLIWPGAIAICNSFSRKLLIYCDCGVGETFEFDCETYNCNL